MNRPVRTRSLAGPALTAAALAVQLTLAATLLVDPPPQPVKELTAWGRAFYLPEHDVPIYLAGVVLGTALGLLLVRIWRRRLDRPAATEQFFRRSLGLQVLAAAAGTALFLDRFFAARPFVMQGDGVPGRLVASFAAIGLLTIAPALAGWPGGRRLGRRVAAARPEPATQAEPPGITASHAGYRFSALDVLVPVGIFLAVFVPDARALAGRSFLQESLLHWDFYAMGPALAFSHGRALATDAYAMYGLGWPALFGGLAGSMPLSFARMMQIGSLYACLYFAGFYLLLRLLVRRPGLAALGTGVAMLQLVLGFHSEVIWVAPSITVLRWPFDVWCLIALVLYSRTGGRRWAVAAGLAIGSGIVFSTDTGLYLGAAAGLWWLATLWAAPDRPRAVVDGLVAGAAGLTALVAGLAAASRGTVFSEAFLRGWLEPLADYRGGFAQLPLSTFPNRATVVIFAALFVGYMATLTWALARITAREAGVGETFFASVSLYGLLTLLHFVGRSYDHTPLRLFLPMVLLGAVAAGRALDRYEARPDGTTRRQRVARFVPLAAAGAGVVAALLLPHRWVVDPVAAYPSVLRSAAAGTPDRRLCLLTDPDDICGLPAGMGPAVERVHDIAARLSRADRAGRTVAVVDESGSLFYLAAGVRPAQRNPRMFIEIYREQKLRDTLEALRLDPPGVVLTRRALTRDDPALAGWPPGSFGLGPSPGSLYPDTWEGLTRLLADRYRLEENLDPFQIWTLRNG